MYLYFQESKIDILLGEVRSSGEEKITHVCVCMGGLHVTIFYSPQAPIKRVWNPLLPQINITEQRESMCTRQIIFENPPEPTLDFDSGTECSVVTC